MRPRLRHRRAPLVAILTAVALGAALVAACGGLFETALRLDAPAKQLAGADVVVTAAEHARLAGSDGAKAQAVTLTERAALPADARDRIAAVDGVERAVARPSLNAIAVTAAPGVDAATLKERISRGFDGRNLSVLTGDDRGRAEATGVAASRLKLVLLSSIFGGMALIVMALLLASIVGLSVEQRRRELALLRTIGATPCQVRRMVIRQTMTPSIGAALAGAFAGPWLGCALFERVQSGGIVADTLALRQGIIPVVAGILAALAVTRVSVAFAARKAGTARLSEALGEVESTPGALGPIRLGLAWAAIAGAVSCGVMTMFMPPANAAATGGGTALAGAVACALFAPRLTARLGSRLANAAHRLAGVPGDLAVLNVQARAHRTAALVIPVTLVVAIALANVYQQTTQADAMRSAYLDGLRADAVVTGAISPQAVELARGVGSASPLVKSTGWIEHPVDRSHRIDPWQLLGVEPSALATKAESGSLTNLRGKAVALPKDVADDLDIDVGDRVGLVLGDGAHVRLRVAALLGGSSRYASIVLPSQLLAQHTTEGGLHQLLAGGGDDVRDRLADALADQPGLTVRGPEALADDFDTGLQVDAWITFAVVGVIVAYAAMSLVNLIVAALAGRRRELALLSLAGATRRQVRRMLQAEALVVAAIGAIAGTAVAIAGLIPLSIATAGSPVPSGPVWVFPAVLMLAAALVLLPTVVVHRTTLNQQKVIDAEAV